MRNHDKTKKELINKLAKLRQRIAKLEALESEYKKAEEALRREKDWREQYLNIAEVMLVIVNADEKITLINKKGYEILGYKEKELIGKNWFDLLVPQRIRDEVKDVFHKLMAGDIRPVEYYENPLLTKDGEERLIVFHNTVIRGPDGQIVAVLFSAEDITQRRKMEEALTQERNLLQALIDNIPDSIYFKDDKNRFIRVNRAKAEHSGTTPDKMIGKTDFDFFPEEQARQTFADDSRVMESNRPMVSKIEKITHADGTEHWFSVTKIPRHNEKGEVIGTMGISRDITELKRAEEESKEAKSHFETLFNFVADPVVIVSGKGKLLEVTDRVQEITGFKKEELVGKSFMKVKILTAKSKAIAIKNLAKRMMGMKIIPYEVEVLTKEGKKMPYEINAAKINYRGKPADMVVFRDLTERKKIQDELQGTLKKLRGALGATIQAMALTVETRDAYTAGHQRRVTNLARTIAKEMKLSKDQIDGIRTAGTIHDLGKIGVPAEILNKPVRLTDIEFNLIKIHPLVGYNILKQIEFPWPVAEIVLQHHERINGSGYPRGLSDGDILLEAKILGVADVVEAMASHRPYRPALGIDEALEEISQNKGVLYDPQVVDTCLKVFRKKRFKFE